METQKSVLAGRRLGLDSLLSQHQQALQDILVQYVERLERVGKACLRNVRFIVFGEASKMFCFLVAILLPFVYEDRC
jgi:hypothetical protein